MRGEKKLGKGKILKKLASGIMAFCGYFDYPIRIASA